MTLPTGSANQDTMYVNNSGTWVEFPYFDYFKVIKKQNQMSEFEVSLFDVSSAQKDYFKEQAEVLLFCGTTMVLKGRIQTIEYKSAYEVTAKGYGMEIRLADKQFIVDNENRLQYDNTSAKTLFTTINSDILTTASSGIFNDDYGNISMRYEYANRLNALGNTANMIDYYWWVSQEKVKSLDYWTDNTNSWQATPTSSTSTTQPTTNFLIGTSSLVLPDYANEFKILNTRNNLGGAGVLDVSDFEEDDNTLGNTYLEFWGFPSNDDTKLFQVEFMGGNNVSGSNWTTTEKINSYVKYPTAGIQTTNSWNLYSIPFTGCSYEGSGSINWANINHFQLYKQTTTSGGGYFMIDGIRLRKPDYGTYSSNFLNVASEQSEPYSIKTFDLTTNTEVIEQERDTSQLVNYVYALGYGDGINQLNTSVYASSTQSSYLAYNINESQSTITCSSVTPFDESGSIRIAKETIPYLGKDTGNSALTGCSRIGIYPHLKNVYVEQDYGTGSSAQTGSSIQVYGVMDYTLIDKTIIDEPTLEVVASGYLSDHKSPIQRIKVTSDEPLTDAILNIGDVVTVTSSEANINGDYHIVGQEYEDNYGVLSMKTELSNKSLEFIEQMKKEAEDRDTLAKYMQGASNIYAITETENMDANHPLNMAFYIPSEMAAINSVKLNFKINGWRGQKGIRVGIDTSSYNSHNQLFNLDYASSGHTGFQPDYFTRDGTLLYPTNAGDNISSSGNIYIGDITASNITASNITSSMLKVNETGSIGLIKTDTIQDADGNAKIDLSIGGNVNIGAQNLTGSSNVHFAQSFIASDSMNVASSYTSGYYNGDTLGGIYVPREDYDDYDFDIGDYTIDEAWHPLTLSSIVPEGAKSVYLRCLINQDNAGKSFSFKGGDAGTSSQITWITTTQVAGLVIRSEGIVPLGANRDVQYWVSNNSADWNLLRLIVQGWFI